MKFFADYEGRLMLAAALGAVFILAAQPVRADLTVTEETVKRSTTESIEVPGSTVVSPGTTTTVHETVKTTTVPSGSVSVTVYAQTLDSQKELITRVIAAGMSSGKLSPENAARLRAELDRINAEVEAAKQSGGMTYTKSIVIARDLDKLAVELSSLLPLSPVSPLIAGSHFTLVGNQVVMVDDIAFRRGQVEFWISDSFAAGKISERTAAILRDQMNQIADVETRYRADGNLDHHESRELYKAFDKVASNLDHAKSKARSLGAK